MKKHIPNSITLINQLSGIIAVIAAYNSQYHLALIFMLLSAVFDFFDGAAARILHVTSDIGKELDSLADMISFGLLPGMVAFRMLENLASIWAYLPYAGFIITLFSALRLAKFNVDTRQSDTFIGLATPANAIFWVGLAHGYPQLTGCISPWITLVAVLVSSALLISEIPMLSLKFHNFNWTDNKIRYIFIIGTIILICALLDRALPIIILWYLLLNIINNLLQRKTKQIA